MAINELRQTCPTLVESCNENAAEYARRTVLLREHGIHPELKEAATGKGLPETTPALLLRVEKSLRAYADAVHDFRKALIRAGGRT